MKIVILILCVLGIVICGMSFYYIIKKDYKKAGKVAEYAMYWVCLIILIITIYAVVNVIYVDKFDEGIYTIDNAKFRQVCTVEEKDELNALYEELLNAQVDEFVIDRRGENLYIVIPKDSYDENVEVSIEVIRVLEKENVISLIEAKEID